MVNKQQYVFYRVILVLTTLWSSTAQDLKTPWLVHTNLNTINGLEMNSSSWNNYTIISGLTGAISVDYHFTQGYLYWTDQLTDRITRASLSNREDKEDLVTYSLDRADGMAVDWIYNHIYWIDATHKHVKVANLDGSLRKTLIDTGLVTPRAIVVHPNEGWLFITDVSDPRIIRCGLDGSNRQTIVSSENTEIDEPNGLSIDFSSNRLYWIDNVYKQIRSSNLNGTDIKHLTTSPVYMPWAWGLIVFGNWIYWTSFTNNTIYRVDKESGLNFEVVKTDLRNPVGIKIYSQENQPTGNTICGQNNGGCEQLCLPSPQSTIQCACADGFQLENDGKICLDIGSGNWLTFANLKTIERLDVDTSVTEKIATGILNAVDLDIHYNKGLVYWTDVFDKKIMRSSVTKDSVSGVVEDVVTEEINIPDGLAIDWIYDLLYWTDTGHDHIQVSRLDGTDRRTIVKDDSLDEPRAIVVDPIRGWLFFSEWGSNPRIERCRMDGTERSTIVNTDIEWPNGMSIDHVGGRLYWIDGKLTQIKSIRFDGSDAHTILKDPNNMPKPFDLVVFGNYVYWTNWQHKSIYRMNKYSGQDLKLVASYVHSPMGIQMFGAEAQVNGDNLCGDDNGMCTHYCFPLPAYDSTSKSTKTGCMCPDFFILKADNKTCTEIDKSTSSTVGSTTSTMANPPGGIVNNGLDTKDIILYSSASGSVIVIGIIAGLYIFYCLRRRRQNPPPCNRENTNDQHNSRLSDIYTTINDEIELASHMENPNNTYLGCVDTNTYETLRSPHINPKDTYSDLNARRDCMQIPPGNHDHNYIDFESNRSDVMTYLTATSHPPKSCVVDDDDPYLSVVELNSKA